MTADISFAELQANLPNNTLIYGDNDVKISIKAMIGSDVNGLDRKVAQALSTLLLAAAKAQAFYNARNTPELSSYHPPTYGIPTTDGSGGLTALRVQTLTVQVPLNSDEITGVTF
ncbi:MAG: hypothetical protein AAF215_27925 [Cyanobacteria bacterium P01_A01_bin.123]